MPDLGTYAVEVTAAYVGSIALLVGILGLSWRRYLRVRAALDEVEKNG
jgi:heme exporter protein D